jgi:putative ABC transport system substrate-binding protein
MMRRREFITLLVGSTLGWPLAAPAQQAALPVVGFLHSGSPGEFPHLVEAFTKGLEYAGFIEGQNVAIEYRWARGQIGRLPELAADLVRRGVAVIAAVGGTSSPLAAKATTKTIPIVFISGGDPIVEGLATSLNRPTGNMTGMTVFSAVLGAKRLELLRELVPEAAEVAMFVNPTGKTSEQDVVEAAAAKVGQRVRVLTVGDDRGLDAAFATIVEQRIGGLLVKGDPFFNSRRAKLVELTTKYRIPTVFPWREYTSNGGLMSYGTSLPESYREMATYVARILNGAKTTDLPVLQPSTFETVINLKAAKALGLTFPMSIILRADEVIE